MLGPCWVMLLALLGRCCVEPMWTHVALIWSHVAPCWADVDSCGEGNVVLSPFGLCAGLYLVSVSLSFGSTQGVCKKNTINTKKNNMFWLCC